MSKENVYRMVECAREAVEKGSIRAAEVYYRMIELDTDPPTNGWERLARGEACWFKAARKIAKGMHGGAADWYQRAVFADPMAVEYRLDYIRKALLPMNMLKSARIEAARATEIDQNHPDAWGILAHCEHALGNVEASIKAHERQLQITPDSWVARIDRAAIAIDTADYETARNLAEDVLASDPEHRGEAYHVLGMCAYREAHHEAAIVHYNLALEAGTIDPSQVRWNMSLAMHAIGQYREGWAESEHRGKQKSDGAMRLIMNRFQQPMLQWADPAVLNAVRQRVHVHQEMGHGDTIAMARYLPELVSLGYEVTFECNEGMVALIQRSFPQIKVVPKAVDYPSAMGIPPFDRHIPALSLPNFFATDVDTVPWNGPYIKPDPELVAKYHALLPHYALDEQGTMPRKVGLCWSSGIRHEAVWMAEYGRRKSMHFNDIRPLMQAGEWVNDFINLQVGPERAQHGYALIDPLPKTPSWDDTAALIANLDLVITVDTAVAHLAGAMGKPVWIIMQRDGASWHFMCWRPEASWNEASPWYPSARIFRQHEFNRPHFWSEVVADVAREIAA
jgi:tetratricopeptide (TPR) repeat protein